MVFSRLNEEQLRFIKETHLAHKSDDRDYILSKKFNVHTRTIRTWISKMGLSERTIVEPEAIIAAKSRKSTGKRYHLVTSAQNATPINNQLWQNMLAYAEFIDAEIHVIPYRYKNPTTTYDLDADYWDTNLVPYFDLNRQVLNNSVEILSDVKIQPTAATPLSGLAGMTGKRHCIVGHAKRQLTCVPTFDKSKIMMTTGSITVKNYTDTKAGAKGEFHHAFGFCIIELDGEDDCHIRQVEALEDGSFYDLFFKVINGKVSAIDRYSALQIGDIHYGSHNASQINNTINLFGSISDCVILHDVFDGYSVNPHEKDDIVSKIKKAKSGNLSIAKEIEDCLLFINSVCNRVSGKVVVVASNHDIFIDRWLRNDFRKDPYNAEMYIDLMKVAISTEKHVLAALIESRTDAVALGLSDNYYVHDIYISAHGHIGTNGSRGSAHNLRQIPYRICIGHSHSPNVIDGVFQSGTATKLRLGYNVGASSWVNADNLIHENSSIQTIIWNNSGKCTTFESFK